MAPPAAKAKLCSLCQRIPFHGLPPFPDSSYTGTISGMQYLVELFRDDTKHKPVPEPLGLRHHADLASLRSAAASGCDLCREIERHADCVLGDIASVKAMYADSPRVSLKPGDPTFELWVTRRGEGGDGFWVSTKSASSGDKYLFVIATFGFCADTGEALFALLLPLLLLLFLLVCLLLYIYIRQGRQTDVLISHH
jgi:hypothetical protein